MWVHADIPTIGLVDVETSIGIEIAKARPPSPAALGDVDGFAGKDEVPAGILIQAIAINRLDKPIHIAVAIIIANRRAHAIGVGDPGRIRNVGEGAIAIIDEHAG